MYKYGPRKKLKTKSQIQGNNLDSRNFTKMYNLELESLNPNSILDLQNKIGNKATDIFLEQLSMTCLGTDGQSVKKNNSSHSEKSKKSRFFFIRFCAAEGGMFGSVKKNNSSHSEESKNDSSSHFVMPLKRHNDRKCAELGIKNKALYSNSTLLGNKLTDDVKDLSKNQKNELNDVLARTMLYKENKQIGRLKLKGHETDRLIKKLDELSSMLKKNDFCGQNKELEIKNSDKMLDDSEKIAIKDTDHIFNMIMLLPKYNGDGETINIYMKMLNLLLNTGVNTFKFLENNGHIDAQKKMLYDVFGAENAAKK